MVEALTWSPQFYTCNVIKAGVADEGTGSKAYLNVGDECNGNTQLGFELPDGSVLGPECESP